MPKRAKGGAGQAVSRRYRRYLALFAAMILIVCGGVLALNAAVDPLWYGRGNIVTGENFAFNERFAKLNQFLRNAGRYDCLIFGSSRTTLLDQTRFSGYSCANLAVSGGVASEFVAIARYIKAHGFSPKLVIVGVDAFNFWRDMAPELPDFVTRGESPPGRLPTYLSRDALSFSLRTLVGDSPFPRYYDSNFVGRILPDAPRYVPPSLEEMTVETGDFHPTRQELYFALRNVFPQARYVGYVPPLSAWLATQEFSHPARIRQYVQTLETIAERYDALYDFSIPSKITMRRDNTYDGDHFNLAVNAKIADVLQGKAKGFGFEVRAASLPAYARAYTDAVARVLQSLRHATHHGR